MPCNLSARTKPCRTRLQRQDFVTAERWVLLLETRKPQTAAGTSSQNRRIRRKAKNAVTKKKIDRGGSRGKRLRGAGTTEMLEQFYTVAEAAEIFKVSTDNATRMF